MSRSKWWWVLEIAGLVPLLAMLALLGFAALATYTLATSHETAVGVVVEKQEYFRSGNRRFDLHYRFTAASGGEYGGSKPVSWDLYDRTAVGDPIEVDYVADAPRNHRAGTGGGAYWFFEIGALVTMLLPPLFLAWGVVRRLRADLRQLRAIARDPIP